MCVCIFVFVLVLYFAFRLSVAIFVRLLYFYFRLSGGCCIKGHLIIKKLPLICPSISGSLSAKARLKLRPRFKFIGGKLFLNTAANFLWIRQCHGELAAYLHLRFAGIRFDIGCDPPQPETTFLTLRHGFDVFELLDVVTMPEQHGWTLWWNYMRKMVQGSVSEAINTFRRWSHRSNELTMPEGVRLEFFNRNRTRVSLLDAAAFLVVVLGLDSLPMLLSPELKFQEILVLHGLTRADAAASLSRAVKIAAARKTWRCCPICEAFSEDLPGHFDTCFDGHAPSKNPETTGDADVTPITYRWKGFPRIPWDVSGLVVKYLQFRELATLRCTAKHMVPVCVFEACAKKMCQDFTFVTTRFPLISSRTNPWREAEAWSGSAPWRSTRPEQRMLVFVGETVHPKEHQCSCSFPQPLPQSYKESAFKIIRGHQLHTVRFRFKGFILQTCIVSLHAEKVLWLPVRVLVELYHRYAGGDGGDDFDFIIGGRALAHLDDPLIKYVWNNDIRKSPFEFVVDVVLRVTRRRLCWYAVHQRPCYTIRFAQRSFRNLE